MGSPRLSNESLRVRKTSSHKLRASLLQMNPLGCNLVFGQRDDQIFPEVVSRKLDPLKIFGFDDSMQEIMERNVEREKRLTCLQWDSLGQEIPSHGLPENMDITVIGLSKSNFQFSIIERKILIETMNSVRLKDFDEKQKKADWKKSGFQAKPREEQPRKQRESLVSSIRCALDKFTSTRMASGLSQESL
ncbi:hypothetical protein MG293_004693 [Ovis ammon polii]|uniref:Uncharacterized protein n=1 Tax=Ovis ammon polii TaxID=230172 RepID=A0AAD4UDF9_OVIAM|nr:hypothetical protein MG293_004693 [Ovis ammon polii]